MLISHKHKFVKIDIEKTGTRSFRESLFNFVDIVGRGVYGKSNEYGQHMTAGELREVFDKKGWNWKEYYSFTIVRDPWERYASLLKFVEGQVRDYEKYMKEESLTLAEKTGVTHWYYLFKDLDFDYAKILKKFILNYNSQDSFFLDKYGECLVDRVGRFEKLDSEFEHLLKQLQIDNCVLKWKNKRKNSGENLKNFYTLELIDLVAEKDKYVIDKYGYTF